MIMGLLNKKLLIIKENGVEIMIVSFDLWGIFWLIVIPPVVLFLCRLSWQFSHSTIKVMNNVYVNRIIERSNELYMENIRLQNQIVNMYEEE